MSLAVSWRIIAHGRRMIKAAAFVAGVLTIPALAYAQSQSPTTVPSLGPLTAISAEWLQMGAGALGRDAVPSLAIAVAHDRPSGLRLEVGYLRTARHLSTASGVTGGVSIPLTRGRLTVRPGVGALVGRAVSMVDDGGYAWQSDTSASDETGYQSHRSYLRQTTVGGAVNLGAEFQLIPALAMTASVRQWIFTGHAISQDRTSTLAGLGLSFHPGAVVWSRASHTELDQ